MNLKAPFTALCAAATLASGGCASGTVTMEGDKVVASTAYYPGALSNITTASITPSKPAVTQTSKPASDHTR